MSSSNLRSKYGARTFDTGVKVQPRTFRKRVAQLDSLDQHFTKLWLDYAMTTLERPQLDLRTRLLVLIGQYTMRQCYAALDDAVRAALETGVKPQEVLEIILQCVVYGGFAIAEPAIRVFHAIAEELGLLESLREAQLPLDGIDGKRSLEAERKTWHPDDAADPRTESMMQKHGWLGVSRGMTLRPKHHLNTLAWRDALDSQYAGLWERFTYQGMYSRGLIDDKTRLLCMVGDCVAVNEMTEGRSHMRGALRNGASPREVMEVINQSAIFFGMPSMTKALKTFVEVITEEGRLAEIGNPPKREKER
jgi:alkylhydroperoxidase/carboxymuconolactone decarboxylase family protein YurZ